MAERLGWPVAEAPPVKDPGYLLERGPFDGSKIEALDGVEGPGTRVSSIFLPTPWAGGEAVYVETDILEAGLRVFRYEGHRSGPGGSITGSWAGDR